MFLIIIIYLRLGWFPGGVPKHKGGRHYKTNVVTDKKIHLFKIL